MSSARAQRPILVAYDGSDSAAAAIAAAGRLLSGATAVVCHVATRRSPEADQTAAEGAVLAARAGLDARPLVVRRQGSVWRELLEVGRFQRARVVVTGAQGCGGIRAKVLGSVSGALVTHSTLPVLVVPAAAAERRAEGPVLLCFDASDSARRAIETAAELLPGRAAIVACAWESWVAHAPAMAAVSGSVRGMATELDELADEGSVRTAGDGIAVAEAAGLEATPLRVRADGPVWRALLDAADELDASALVVGARGMTGISRALGSVSHGVLHHSTRPVLAVPPFDTTS